MKRVGNLFQKIICKQNLYLAHVNARKGKTWYIDVRETDQNLQERINYLHDLLKNKQFRTSQYDIFQRWSSGKIRVIYRLPYFPDRIVHHAIIQIILPYLIRNLIADTYACVPGRGLHKCSKKIKRILRQKQYQNAYCLKLDIIKFYPSINHDILQMQLRRLFKCKQTLELLDQIIESIHGLPIGNYTSQHLANLYLSQFDHWIKQIIRMKNYFRYSDDMVLIHNDKFLLHEVRKEIQEYLWTNLELEVNDNWQVFSVKDRGIDFLGYRFFNNFTLLRKSIASDFKIKMKQIQQGRMQPQKAMSCVASYYGWLIPANTMTLRRKYITDDVKNNIKRYSEIVGCRNPIDRMVV